MQIFNVNICILVFPQNGPTLQNMETLQVAEI
jgi:hypothetical protein